MFPLRSLAGVGEQPPRRSIRLLRQCSAPLPTDASLPDRHVGSRSVEPFPFMRAGSVKAQSPLPPRQGQALDPDMARAGQPGQEQAFAAEQRGLDLADIFDVEIDLGRVGDDAAGVDPQRLAARELALLHRRRHCSGALRRSSQPRTVSSQTHINIIILSSRSIQGLQESAHNCLACDIAEKTGGYTPFNKPTDENKRINSPS